MNRKIKNIIMIFICVLSIGSMVLTIWIGKNSINNSNVVDTNTMNNNKMPSMNDGGTPPDMNNNSNTDTNDNDSVAENTVNNNDSSVSEMRGPGAGAGNGDMKGSGDRGGRQNRNSDSNDNSNSNSNTPPEMPDGNNNMTPPDMQNGDNSSNSNMPNKGGFGHMKDFNNSSVNNNGLAWYYYLIFGCEALIFSISLMYLIMSHFNKKNAKDVFKGDKLIIYILGTIVMTGVVTTGVGLLGNSISKSTNNVTTIENSKTSVSSSGSLEITSKKSISNKTYKNIKSDQNAILVKEGGNATLNKVTVNKTGDSSNTENADFTGVNAGILVEENSSATIKNSTIKTNGKGANAVFSTGSNSKISISDSTIETTGSSSSRGLDATYGGSITGSNLKITTQGNSSATLATDRGEGAVSVSGSTLETNGVGSPIIYSTGNISINKTTGVAKNSQMVVVEGKNSATVKNSTLEASGKGNRGSDNKTDSCGVMIYQSMSGDASEGVGTFTSNGSTLTIPKDSDYYDSAPMFFVTNTEAIINLTNTKLNYGSGVLLNIGGTTEWGNSGSNGGVVTVNLEKEDISGDIIVDNISTLTLNLKNSKLSTTINGSNSAKSIKLVVDSNSTLTLTGDSYVSSFEGDASNINFNGYKLYVNGTSIN